MNKSISKPIRNQRGQTLIEYIIIVAIVGVGSISLMRAVGKQINYNFATVVDNLGGTIDGKMIKGRVTKAALKTKDMTNFADGLDKKNSSSNDDSE